MSHKDFCLATLENLMKYCPDGSYLVLKSTPMVPGDIPLMDIKYKYNYRKILVFISTEGSGSTEPGDTYLSNLTDIYSNVSICPVVCNHLLEMYFNACNEIDNYNRMRHSGLALEKYWVTHSGY